MAEQSKVAKSATTVTVGCKLPHGIIIRGYRMEEFDEPVFGGGTKRSSIAVHDGRQAVIAGVAKQPGEEREFPLVGGFALTHGVPADLMEQWLKANADMPAVRNGLVFCHSQEASARSIAKENRANVSGLEPIDPKKPPQVSRRVKITPATVADVEADAA